jgi:anti-sigma factor RsiW
MTELTCRDVAEFLMAYLAHELEPAQREAFEAHVAVCDRCVAYIRSYEQTVRLGKAAFGRLDQPVDEQVPQELVAAILAARRPLR